MLHTGACEFLLISMVAMCEEGAFFFSVATLCNAIMAAKLGIKPVPFVFQAPVSDGTPLFVVKVMAKKLATSVLQQKISREANLRMYVHEMVRTCALMFTTLFETLTNMAEADSYAAARALTDSSTSSYTCPTTSKSRREKIL